MYAFVRHFSGTNPVNDFQTDRISSARILSILLNNSTFSDMTQWTTSSNRACASSSVIVCILIPTLTLNFELIAFLLYHVVVHCTSFFQLTNGLLRFVIAYDPSCHEFFSSQIASRLRFSLPYFVKHKNFILFSCKFQRYYTIFK